MRIADCDIYLNNAGTFSAPLGATTHQDKIALNLTSGKLFPILPGHEFENRIDRQIRLKLAADGSAVAQVRYTYRGGKYAANQPSIRRLVPETSRRTVEKIGHQLFPGAQLVRYKIDFDCYPGIIQAEFTLRNGATSAGHYLVCSLPLPDWSGAFDGVSAQRKHDLYCNDSFTAQNEYEIIAPPGFVPLHGQHIRGTEQIGRFDLYSDVRIDRDRIHLRYRVNRPPELIPAERVATLQNLRNRRFGREYFRLLFVPEELEKQK